MSRTAFLDKTLLAVAHVAEQALFSEAYARKRGLLQAIDVRIKLVGFFSILIMTSFLHTPQALWMMYGLSLLLAIFSRVSIVFFLKRVWLFVPLFSAAIVLPALLNVITPGEPIWTIMTFDHPHVWGPYVIPREISITGQGIRNSVIFVARVATSVSFTLLFTFTTGWAEVFGGLRALFVPRMFVMTLSMTERYLFVYLRMIQDMYRARKSRTIRPLSVAAERNWTASRIGVTFKKSMEMSADVYHAMLSRGFHGDFPSINRFHATGADYFWFATVLCFGGMLLLIERGLLF